MPLTDKLYDCLIVGGGPAGLSAAIYMGRFLRSTLVVDEGEGRSSFAQINDNYLGFPNGVAVRELRERGRQHAERFGVEFQDGRVERLERAGRDEPCVATTTAGVKQAKTVILCTGVRDIWPSLPNVLDYVGKTLFWCITCDGFRAVGKKLVLFGNDDEAAVSACQFKVYSDDISFVFEPGTLKCSDERVGDMESHGIRVVEGKVRHVEGRPDEIKSVVLTDGERLPADLLFSLLGCTPNSDLAKGLGAECDSQGYIKVDQEGYTSVPGVFCAGDLSRMHTHQVVAAAHEGAEAAQTANYWLYACYQRNEPDLPTKQELVARVRSSG